ncbi:MAG: YqgE/AlgH family protein [Rhodothermales bacterium]|nr:YqgE/AlgH family protein [Rhodothermales bacterium]
MIEPGIKLESGRILIAPPLQWDLNFRDTVVLLCEHSENGSFGLILNRTLTIEIEQLFDDLGPFEDVLHWGGPVQPDTMHFLHRLPDEIPGAIPLGNDLYWGGDFDVVRRKMTLGAISPDDIRFFLGYAGWMSGQLELEVAARGWILGDAAAIDIFGDPETDLWRESLESRGGLLAVVAGAPDSFSLN